MKPTSKVCRACRLDLPFASYAPAKKGKFGLKARCQECLTAENRARYLANRERHNAICKAWAEANRAHCRELANARNRAYRLKALAIYGGCCGDCGSTDGLVFDHINGGGSAHRAVEGSHSYVRRIARNGVPDPSLQVLCADCHAVKTSRECSEAGRLGMSIRMLNAQRASA